MRNKLLILGGLLLVLAGPSPIHAESSETYRQLNLFGDVFELIREEYVEEVDDPELIEAAINGMLSSLDPHSSYLNPQNFEDMQVQTRGEFGGLGIEVTMDRGLVKVISPIDDTPAARAGMQAGDYITHLDGEQILGMTLSDAVEKMRGAPGTSIRLTVARPGEEEPFDMTITRDNITIRSVRHRLEGDIGYIRVTSFNEKTEKELKASLADMKEQKDDDLKGFILDLRNNPGGLLDQAIAVSDAFLEKGEIVSTRGRQTQDTQRYQAHAGDLAKEKPIIVLINRGSASASEIVAGALQDHQRAIILGTKSFGKGSVQTIRPLGNNGAVRLTTAKYYTPSGRSIQAKGIEPDIVVEPAKIERTQTRRPFRSEADLPNHLEDSESESGDGNGDGEESVPSAPIRTDDGESQEESGDRDEIEDYQLNYAIDLMRGLTLLSGRI